MYWTKKVIGVIFYLLVAFAALGKATQNHPFLRINTKMHHSSIYRLDFDDELRYILTVSKDKTAKLWNASSGDLLRTFRPSIGEGTEGMLKAGAISGDGKLVLLGSVVASSNTYASITGFDPASGEMLFNIGGLPGDIRDIEFSEDGQYFAVGMTKGGVWVYRAYNQSLVARLNQHKGEVTNLCFDRKGNLYTVCNDGAIRVFDRRFRLVNENSNLAGEQPYSISVSDNSSKLVVGYYDEAKLQVFDAKSLDLLFEPELGQANTYAMRMHVASFSHDGKYLYAGGYYRKEINGKVRMFIRQYKKGGEGTYNEMPISKNTIFDIKSPRQGGVVFAGYSPDVGRVDQNGNVVFHHEGSVLQFNLPDPTHLRISQNGKSVSVGSRDHGIYAFSIEDRILSDRPLSEGGAISHYGDVRLTKWHGQANFVLNGKTIEISKGKELTRCVDVDRKTNNFLVGTDERIACFNPSGKQLWEVKGLTTWAVKISGDGEVFAAAFSDGTIRWFRFYDGKPLLSLFVAPSENKWLTWTPSGFYDAALGADDLIGWHINKNKYQAAYFYPASRFRGDFYAPYIIDNIIDLKSEKAAISYKGKQKNDNSKQTDNTSIVMDGVTQKLPPMLNIITPLNGQSFSKGKTTIEYSVESPNNEPINTVKVLLDGRPIDPSFVKGKTRGIEMGAVTPVANSKLELELPPHDLTLSLLAENKYGWSEAVTINLKWGGHTKNNTPDILKPTLYVLAVGISDYAYDRFDLQFAAKDAQDFVASLKNQNGGLYKDVKIKLLTDQEASKNNILDGLEWIEKETTSRDMAIIYLAGHGVNDNRGSFYYLPYEADLGRMKSTCLRYSDIKYTISSIAGKVVVFTDACHSGNILGETTAARAAPDINTLIGELVTGESGVVVFTSSTGNQYSLENEEWNNGAFTKAVVEGLKGSADLFQDGSITIKTLDAYITNRVKELTKGLQSPTTIIPQSVPDFPLAIVR